MSRILGPILLTLLLVSSAFAINTDTVALTNVQGDEVRLDLVESDDAGLRLSFELPKLTREEIAIENKAYQLLSFEGADFEGEAGRPAMPVFTQLVAVPNGVTVRARVAERQSETLGGYRLLPMQPEEGDRFHVDADYYSGAVASLTPPAVEVSEVGIMGGLPVVSVTLRPVEFDPVSGDVLVSSSMELALDFEGAPLPLERDYVPESIADLYRDRVVGADRILDNVTEGPGTYLLIYTTGSGISGDIDDIVEWRSKQGYNVIATSTSGAGGNNTTSIKNYIQNIYNSVDPPLEFITLVGDASGTYGLATYYENVGSGYDGEGDHYYTMLEGGDILPDAHIGRLSIGGTSDMSNITDKILGYESTPEMSDPGWYKRACLVGDESSSGITTIFVSQWAKHLLIEEGWTDIDTIWGGNFSSQMVASLNQGMTWFSYRGYWGNSGYTSGHAQAQTNGLKLPFVVDITCDTGTFGSGTAMNEAFLRAANGGGIGAIATATIGTHTRYNNAIFNGIAWTYLKSGNHYQGAALTGGKLSMYENYFLSQPGTTEEWMVWNNLMGDPATNLWTDVPADLDVTHPGTLHIGANTVAVNVMSEGFPLEGARVSIWKDGDVLSHAYTDQFGDAFVPMDASSQGTLYVTVTGHDLYPYQGTLSLGSQSVFCALNGTTVDGDGRVNPGETIALGTRLYNYGSSSASSVTATLSENDPYLTVIDGSDSYGTIPSGGSAWGSGGFTFAVSADTPNDHVAQFELVAVSGVNSWTSLVELIVDSGEFTVQSFDFSGPGGDLNPGESGTLSLTIRNDGNIATGAISATLSSETPWITVSDADGSFGSAGIGSSVNNAGNPFSIAVAADCFDGHLANLFLLLEYNGGAEELVEFQLQVGNVSSNDPVGPDNYGYYAFDNTDTSYPYAAVYDWVEIDPAYGGPGTDTGLYDFGWEQDDVRQYDLPFDFQYYGDTYDRISICSNGWFSFGEFDVPLYRNWSLPSPGTPPNVVAVYWDNLDMSGTNKVYHWHDTAQDRYIIQWSRMKNDYSNATETVQVILYDPATYPTSSGDGEMLMQYMTVNQTDSRDGYGTVGIQNRDMTDGLLYTYWNQYAPGAMALTSGRAIRFVPVEAQITGVLAGTVTNESAGGTPAAGVHVKLVETGQALITGEDGSFLGPVPIGEYTVVAEHPSFEPDTLYNVLITEGLTYEHDFSLVDIGGPSISGTTVHPYTTDTVGPYVIQTTVTDYSPMTTLDLKYIVMGSGSGTVPLTLIDAENNLYEASIPGQPLDTFILYWIKAEDIAGNESSDPIGAPSNYYGFWVAEVEELFYDEMEGGSNGWTVGDPADDATTGVWQLGDPAGTIDGESRYAQPEDDHTPAPGVNAWITGLSGGNVGDNDVDGGQTTLYSPIFDLSESSGVSVNYYRWYINDSGNAPDSDFWRVQVSDDGTNWESLEYTDESTHLWVHKYFELSGVIEMTSTVQFRFIAADDGDGSIVEAGVDDFQLLGYTVPEVTDVEDAIPARAELLQNVPNPFNPKTDIRFALPSAQDVSLKVYDVKGRQVTTLMDGPVDAGYHTVTWNGTDRSGRQMSSGVYFYVLKGEDLTLREKMVLLK